MNKADYDQKKGGFAFLFLIIHTNQTAPQAPPALVVFLIIIYRSFVYFIFLFFHLFFGCIHL